MNPRPVDDDDDACADEARERVKRALVRVVLTLVREEIASQRGKWDKQVPAAVGAFDEKSVAESALVRCERAFVNARALRGVVPAACRRDGRAIAGRMLVGACARDGGATMATAAEAAAFAGVDARATGRMLRFMHANGKVVSQGAIAAEDAFEAVSDVDSGVVGARWLARVEREHARATRFCRRALGLTRARGEEEEAVQALSAVARDDDDGAFDLVDEWLFRGAPSDDDDDDDDAIEESESEEDALEDADMDDMDDAEAFASMNAAPSNENEGGDPEQTEFIPVEGAEIRDVEKDNEYFIREIMSLQGASDAEIAQRIQRDVDLTKGAENSVGARRALMMQSLFKQFGRTDTASASHTGATVRESSSTHSRHKFFNRTENKTRIERRNKPLEFKSVTEYVRSNKKAEEARARRIASMLGKH